MKARGDRRRVLAELVRCGERWREAREEIAAIALSIIEKYEADRSDENWLLVQELKKHSGWREVEIIREIAGIDIREYQL
jgi:hypothetical protein